jgi:predicted nucleic acid-binding protein
MKIYADTSFLASLYLAHDGNHGAALAVATAWKTPPRLIYTPLAQLELRNVMARGEHQRRMTPGDTRACLQLVKEDITSGMLDARPLRAYEWLDASQKAIEQVTPLTGTRTLDAMHIALANLNGAKTFLSFDANQRKAAKASGFALLPA